MDEVKKQGADEVYDYRKTQPEALEKIDSIFDTAGKNLNAFRKCLKPSGRLLTIAFAAENPIRGVISILFSARHGQHRTRLVIEFPNSKNLSQLTDLVESSKIVPVLHSTYPMEQIAAAHRQA